MSTQLKVVVASTNPVKVKACEQAFVATFSSHQINVTGHSTESGVSEQPMSLLETKQGAINRLANCQSEFEADYYVSYEGGVDSLDGIFSTFAIICISDGQRVQTGRTANLPLPKQIQEALEQGAELGPSIDKLFNTHNIKQKGGAIGMLTQGLATRLSTYEAATILTLVPFVHPQLYYSA